MSARMCLLLGSTALLMGGGATPALSSEHQFTEHLNRAQLEYRAVPHHRVAWVRRWVWDDFWGDYHVVWVPRVTAYRTVSYAPHSHRIHLAMISDGSGDNASAKSKDASDSKDSKSDNSDKSDKSDKDSKAAAADSHTAASEPNAAKSDKDTTIASVEPMARPEPPANADKDAKLASIDTHPKPTSITEKPAQTAEKPAANVKADLAKPVTPAEIRTALPLGKVSDPKQTLASTPIKSVWGDTIGKVRGMNISGGNVKTVDADLGGKDVVKMDPARLKYVKSRGLLITTLSKDDAAKLPKADNS